MLESALSALQGFLDPSMLLMLIVGVVAGLVMGIIPGLGGTGAVAVLLPFVLVLEPQQALAMIIGAVAVVHTSDTITSVLLGVPGSAAATVMLQDGHTMAKEGKAARALSLAFLASIAGGILGAAGLTLAIPVARPLVLAFGAPELFMLTILGVSLTALLSRGNVLKGLVAGALGLLVGQVGAAPAAADYRFTFDQLFLNEGLDLVAVALGIFGLAEILHLLARGGAISNVEGVGGGWGQGVRDFVRHWMHVLRGAFVGVWAGMLPGVGATAGAWIAYGQAMSTAKDKKKFGRGDPRGIIAPESAAHSIEAGDLIPTLLFGIPGAAPAALLMGALLTYGVEPGPRMITDHLDLVYTIIWAFAFATIIGAAVCFLISSPLARFSKVRFPVIGAGLIVVMFVSAYQEPQQFGVLQVMLVLGVGGWLMRVAGWPRAPFLIGFVLSAPMERYYFLTDNLYEAQQWLTRPFVLGMLALIAIPLVLMGVRALRRRRAVAAGADQAPQTAPDPTASLERTWVPAVMAVVAVIVFGAALVMSTHFSRQAALMPRIVGGAGLVLALSLAIREVVRRRAHGAQRIPWYDEVRWAVYSLLWLVLFLALVVLGGTLIATVLFVPVFLRAVAGVRWWKIAVYTLGLVVALVLLWQLADISLPVGYFTPEILI